MTDPEKAPSEGPTATSMAAQAGWQRLTAESLPAVRESAGKWRDGLAALITLVTAGLVVSGPDNAGDLPTGWRWAIGAGLVGGMILVLIGLLLILAAAAGTPRALSLGEFTDLGGDRNAVDALQAKAGAARLKKALRFAVPGIFVVLIAIGAWLVSPSRPPSSLQVTTADVIYCGQLSSGDNGVLVLDLEGESQPVKITYADVENVAVADSCSAARASR